MGAHAGFIMPDPNTEPNIFQAIDQLLKAGNGEGKLTLQLRDSVLLAAIKDLSIQIHDMNVVVKKNSERIQELERKNILMLMEKYPGRFTVLVTFITIVVMIVHEWFPALAGILVKILVP